MSGIVADPVDIVAMHCLLLIQTISCIVPLVFLHYFWDIPRLLSDADGIVDK